MKEGSTKLTYVPIQFPGASGCLPLVKLLHLAASKEKAKAIILKCHFLSQRGQISKVILFKN